MGLNGLIKFLNLNLEYSPPGRGATQVFTVSGWRIVIRHQDGWLLLICVFASWFQWHGWVPLPVVNTLHSKLWLFDSYVHLILEKNCTFDLFFYYLFISIGGCLFLCVCFFLQLPLLEECCDIHRKRMWTVLAD